MTVSGSEVIGDCHENKVLMRGINLHYPSGIKSPRKSTTGCVRKFGSQKLSERGRPTLNVIDRILGAKVSGGQKGGGRL